MANLYVCGEALIDFVPDRTADGAAAFQPKTGGSPYNAARAASLAGADAWFVGALSSDLFGEQLEADLSAAGVNCSLALRSDDPTTLAFVDISQGSPRYAFFNNGTATRNTSPPDDLIDPSPFDILEVGSISLIDKPGAEHIADYCAKMAGRMRLSIDPNARPSMTTDKQDWVDRINRLTGMATIIKISDEDLEYLAPGSTPDAYAAQMLAGSAELVVVTLGEQGARGYSRAGTAQVTPPKIDVADTVGAGDALMGAMLAWLLEHCPDDNAPIGALSDRQLTDMLTFAAVGAAINCTRVGAAPPTKAEILESIGTATA